MNAARSRQNSSSAQQGQSNPSTGQGSQSQSLFSAIGKLVGGNANLLPLIATLAGNKSGTGAQLSQLTSLMGMLNNNNSGAAGNPLSGLAGMMSNLGGMNNAGNSNPFQNMGGMNNAGNSNLFQNLAGMMNQTGNNFSGYKNNPAGGMPNIDPNEIMAKLSSMMKNNAGAGFGQNNAEEAKEDPVIETEENPRGRFSAKKQEETQNQNFDFSGLNMENLSAFWPLISSLLNNNNGDGGSNSGSGSGSNSNSSTNDTFGRKTDNNSKTYYPPNSAFKRTGKGNTYLDLADGNSEPYSACFDCMHPCFRRQISLPSFGEVQKMAEGWSRY